MTSKQDALVEVVSLIRNNGLTLPEIAAALQEKTAFKTEKSSGVLGKILGYIGGIFVFSGLCLFIGMHWDDIGPAVRIMLTLGVGFCLFVMAVTAAKDPRLERAATPLFIVAALLQPTGIIVALKEYSHGGDPAYGLLFMNFVMLVQQGLVFYALRRTFLALTSVFFGFSLLAIAFDLLHVDHTLQGFVFGLSLMCIAWALGNSPHRAIAGIIYFVGSVSFLSSSYDWLRHTPAEPLFLGLSCGMIYVSTAARSRTLLTIGTLATIGYIGYFTAEHFADSGAWPLVLMLMGAVLIGFSVLAVKLNNKYIKQRG